MSVVVGDWCPLTQCQDLSTKFQFCMQMIPAISESPVAWLPVKVIQGAIIVFNSESNVSRSDLMKTKNYFEHNIIHN